MSYIGNAPISAAFLTDTFSGTGSQTAFTMTVAPANTSSIIVAITGVLQDPSTYSVSGTTLTFSAAPPSGTSNISVRYLGIPASGVTTTAYRTVTEFTATSGQTSFSVPSYTVGYIDVYRNGVMLGTADFTATTGTTVVLASGATTGDLIRTESFYVSSVLNAIPNSTNAVTRVNMPLGSVLQVVQTSTSANSSTTSTTFTGSGLTASITPTSATSKILVSISGGQFRFVSSSSTGEAWVQLWKSVGGGGYAAVNSYGGTDIQEILINYTNSAIGIPHSLIYLDSPATTSTVTYQPYFKTNNSAITVLFNLSSVIVYLTLMEIAA
jgi:hypothetical protein